MNLYAVTLTVWDGDDLVSRLETSFYWADDAEEACERAINARASDYRYDPFVPACVAQVPSHFTAPPS